jgi:hypothetical protein
VGFAVGAKLAWASVERLAAMAAGELDLLYRAPVVAYGLLVRAVARRTAELSLLARLGGKALSALCAVACDRHDVESLFGDKYQYHAAMGAAITPARGTV